LDSRRLADRLIQPGNVRTFLKSEELFHLAAADFEQRGEIIVTRKPKTLRDIFSEVGDPPRSRLGIEPDEEILHSPSGRRIFFEVKNQGDQGNAEERAYKHHTSRFTRRLQEKLGLEYHPFFTVFTGALAKNPRYTLKFRFLIEEGHYFLWDNYDSPEGIAAVSRFIGECIDRYLLRPPKDVAER